MIFFGHMICGILAWRYDGLSDEEEEELAEELADLILIELAIIICDGII